MLQDSSRLQVNLDALAAAAGAAPDFAAVEPDMIRVETTPVGPTASIRTPEGRWIRLHSGRDPVAEADRSVTSLMANGSPPLIILIGSGLGYLLDAIERHSPATRVLAIEPLPAVAHAMLSRRTWQHWFTSGRLTLLVGPHYAGAGDAWRCLDANVDAPVVVAPVLAREFAAEVIKARDLIKQAQFGVKANAEARRKFAPRYLLNTIRNVPVISDASDVTALYDAFAGIPAVVIAAGPSLDRNLEELRQLHGRALLIAVDTALRPLLEAGMEPELVVAVDPSELNARHLRNLPDAGHTWLVGEGSLDPAAFEQFAGRTFTFCVSNHQPWPWLRRVGVGKGRLRAWGSVLTSALDLALKCGCDPIVFAGADLAYSGRQPYCRGTIYEHDWAVRAAAGESLVDIWNSVIEGQTTTTIPDVAGQPVPTTPLLLAFRDWLVEQSTSHSARRFINGTGGGVLMGGRIEQGTLSGVLDTRNGHAFDGVVAVRAAWSGGRLVGGPDRFALGSTLGALSTVSSHDEPIASWLQFGGPALTIENIRAALRRAGERSLGPDGECAASRSRVTIARGAPERVMAIRLAITGQPLSGEPMGSARVAGYSHREEPEAAMVRAGLLLMELLQTSGLLASEGSSVARRPSVGSPASRAFDWSPAAMNLVLDYEAALAEMLAHWAAPNEPALRTHLDLVRVTLLRTGQAEDAPAEPLSAAESGVTAARLALVADLLSVLAALEGELDGFIPTRDDRAVPIRVAASLVRAYAEALRPGSEMTSRVDAEEVKEAVAAVTLAGARHCAVVGTPMSQWVSDVLTGKLVRVPLNNGPSLPTPRLGPLALSVLLPVGVSGAVIPVSLSIRPRRAVSVADRLPAPSWSQAARFEQPSGWVTPLRLNGPQQTLMVGNVLDETHALFTIVNGTHSICIDATGRLEPDTTWPRPICGQVRWGTAGAVAWHNETSVVLWRESAHGEVRTDTVPFEGGLAFPQSDGSIWWTSTSGLWTWTPGRAWSRLVETPPLMGLRIDTGGFRLDLEGDSQGFTARPRITEALRWVLGSTTCETLALGQEGPCWSISSAQDWTALAFPHSDHVLLRHRDGDERVLTCTYPFNVAWAGTSLVVSTGSGDLMLFRDLLTWLELSRPDIAGTGDAFTKLH